MRLWHDDVRPAPSDEWTWVKNNDEAKKLIEDNLAEIVEMSLDHDLGADLLDIDFDKLTQEELLLLKGQADDNGYELVKWMCETLNLPPNAKITIHSWNQPGAERMVALLRDHKCEASYIPYTLG